MAVTLAVANQKGGVAKTTTVQCLGVALAELGRSVLLVDLDPQACLTYSCGFDPDSLERSLHDVLARRSEVADVVVPVAEAEGLRLVPASIDLAGAEVHLLSRTGREHVLARAIEPVAAESDVVLVDCPPSLGVLTINGLTAADSVVVPMQCEGLSQRGVGQLLETVRDVRDFANPELGVLGVVATMFDRRTRHSRAMVEAGELHGLPLLGPPIPKSVRFAEAPHRGAFDLGPGTYVGRRGGVPDVGREPRRSAGAGVTAGERDPLGKRALFSVPEPEPVPEPTAEDELESAPGPEPGPQPDPGPEPGPGADPGAAPERATPRPTGRSGPITVTCGSCHAVSGVSLIDFVLLQLPFACFVPGRRFDHKMTCPACRQRVWAGVTLRRPGPPGAAR